MRPALDFNTLKVFIAVVEKESFVGASKLLEMPTSNVSRCISQLEEKLDLQLIERSTRHMKLTQAGQLLYTRAKPLLEALEQTETELTLRQMQLKGPLRICIPNEIGPALLGSVIAEFACQYPDLEISCVTNLSGFESLRDDLDLAIIISRGQMDNSDYIARHLVTIPCTIVAAPSLIQRYGTPTRIEQFEELPCITTVSALKGAPWQFVNKKGEFEAIKVKGHYRVNSGEMAGQAAVAGIGFAILSKQTCQPYISDGRLVEIEFEQKAAPLQLFSLYSNRRYLPTKTRALIDFIHQKLSHISL
ncbi:TPA: LysR family transcriptional regulator [Acinetobacter nosocomialis]|uniref:LysR family transcriptional regulator n=1 Tax=Acinetobacter calcoaceticus/baumannii complex TaxID=909768 RepID=UPI0002AEC043|nr:MULTISPECIES: LysR family transcriptional regulator [Acinetobacter calcoaceticus/baumannii complex]ELW81461.1 LysR substrate-binding domain protein [Acinetobacter sp. OIFC021]EXE48924.1 bacterial regulatory helix-turn-helix, lysR family protein [Acinetobacter sp. 766875]MDE1666574.1 LysR family transcriptional regulator [Acinetobacter nosocomialis]MDE9416905.1 LysR family transcriptional regulator [Acinetobacter nosocomialis]HAI55213.1 LysR family transcriptional regulator [Acinetobacter no